MTDELVDETPGTIVAEPPAVVIPQESKPVFSSLTMIAGGIAGALQALESTGAIPPGVSSAVAEIAKSIAMLVSLFGLRRAVGTGVTVKL